MADLKNAHYAEAIFLQSEFVCSCSKPFLKFIAFVVYACFVYCVRKSHTTSFILFFLLTPSLLLLSLPISTLSFDFFYSSMNIHIIILYITL
jgi:hypothetical protein